MSVKSNKFIVPNNHENKEKETNVLGLPVKEAEVIAAELNILLANFRFITKTCAAFTGTFAGNAFSVTRKI
jgi:starvation-inducible DNA-binding protein